MESRKVVIAVSIRVLFTLGLALLGGPALAQSTTCTAYPIDAIHADYGHWNPFGICLRYVDECREQMLVPAAYLPPTGGLITALEVSPHTTGVTPYQSLTISMGHTTVSSLGLTFAANLSVPVVVYSLTSHTLTWGPDRTWHRLAFPAPFRYDGQSNLVIEFQKIIDRPNHPQALHTVMHQYTRWPARMDLPQVIWTEGQYGSGAALAPTATFRYNSGPLLVRLVWADARTLTIAGPLPTGKDYFHLGSRLTLEVQARPGEAFLLGLGLGLAPHPLRVPGIQGVWRLPTLGPVLGAGLVDGQGRGTVPVWIPNLPNLVGAHVFFQAAVVGPGVWFTNVADAIVAP